MTTLQHGRTTHRPERRTPGPHYFDSLAGAKYVLLTTFKRDGTPVATPVHVVTDGDRAFFRTWHTSGKAKRLRHSPHVTVAPSTMRGKAAGPALKARARLLQGDAAGRAAQLLTKKHPLLQGAIIPLIHRLRGWQTIHFELTAPDEEQAIRGSRLPQVTSADETEGLDRVVESPES